MMGFIRLIAGSGGYYTGLQDKVARISGIIPTIFGAGLVLIGIILLFFPDLLHSLFDQVINLFNK
jgi:hypothetical protein